MESHHMIVVCVAGGVSTLLLLLLLIFSIVEIRRRRNARAEKPRPFSSDTVYDILNLDTISSSSKNDTLQEPTPQVNISTLFKDSKELADGIRNQGSLIETRDLNETEPRVITRGKRTGDYMTRIKSPHPSGATDPTGRSFKQIQSDSNNFIGTANLYGISDLLDRENDNFTDQDVCHTLHVQMSLHVDVDERAGKESREPPKTNVLRKSDGSIGYEIPTTAAAEFHRKSDDDQQSVQIYDDMSGPVEHQNLKREPSYVNVKKNLFNDAIPLPMKRVSAGNRFWNVLTEFKSRIKH